MFIRSVGLFCVGLALLAFPAPVLAGDTNSAPGPAHAGGTESGHGQVDINPIPMSWEQFQSDAAIWTAVVFLVVMAILWKFAWGPLTNVLDKREKHIADQITDAEDVNQQAKELLAAYEKRLAEAGSEVQAMLDQGRRDAEQTGQELIEKARAEAKTEQARALRQIESAEAAALENLADRSASLALELAGKIVHARLSRKDHERLIEQAVARFAETTPQNREVSRN